MKYIKFILAAVALISSAAASKECGKGIGSCKKGLCCSKYGYCGTSEDYCGTGCQSGYGKCLTSNKKTSTKKTTKKTSTKKTSTKKTSTKKTSTKKTSTKKTSTKKTSTKKTSTKKTSTKKTTKTTTKKPSQTNDVKVSKNGKCGSSNGVCPKNQCCSQYGYCGTSSDYCGNGCQSEFGRCDNASNNKKTSTKKTTTTKKTSSKTTKSTTSKTTKKTTTTKKSTATKISTSGKCGDKEGACPDGYCCSQYGYCGKSDDYCGSGCQSEFGKCETSSSSGSDYTPSNSKPASSFAYYYECKNKKDWALTFDDGPYKFDEDLLDYLKERGVKATFFINGDNVMDIKSSRGKKIVQRMYNEGHIIGSHTWKHVDISEVSKDELIYNMTELEKYIEMYTGKKPAFMRPPYGAGHDNEKVGKILKDLGYSAAVMWNVDTLDWDKSGNVDYALSVFKKKQSKGKGLLSLNHCYYKDITKERLIKLTGAEIDYMLSQGYKPVTMDKCLGLKPYQE